MGYEHLAGEIYQKTAERLDGKNSREFASELHKQADRIGQLQENVGGSAKQLMDGAPELKTAEHDLHDAAKSVEKFDVKNAKKPGNVGGDAELSARGSAEIDFTKHVDEHGLADADQLRAVYVHEVGENDTQGHEHQKKPDAANVKIGEQTISQTAFIEVGAIIGQVDAVPESINWLSGKYRKNYYEDMLGLMPDRKRLQELSMNGQFRQFAREVEARMAA